MLLSVLAATIGLTLAACGDDAEVKAGEEIVIDGETVATEDMLADCQADGGEFTYYTTTPPESFEGIAKDFEEDTGIKVTPVRSTTNELYSKVISEHAGGRVGGDVMSINDPTLRQDLYDRGIVKDFTIPNEDIVKKAIGDNPQFGFAKPSRSSSQVIAWNTAKVDEKDAPRSYADLLDPKWKGKFAMTAVQTGLSSIVVAKSIYDGLGADKIEQFGQQKPQIFPSVVPMTQALVRGSVPVAITDVALILNYQSEGNPVDWAPPAEGTPTWGNSEMIAKDAEHPACAEIWVAWSSSLRGAQARWEHAAALAPRTLASPDVRPEGAPDLGKIYSVDVTWLLENRDSFVEEWAAMVPQS